MVGERAAAPRAAAPPVANVAVASLGTDGAIRTGAEQVGWVQERCGYFPSVFSYVGRPRSSWPGPAALAASQ